MLPSAPHRTEPVIILSAEVSYQIDRSPAPVSSPVVISVMRRKRTDVSVGRTYQHTNRDILIAGNPLPADLVQRHLKGGRHRPDGRS
jgi:hypothetical protein